jgi:hypothetical protein
MAALKLSQRRATSRSMFDHTLEFGRFDAVLNVVIEDSLASTQWKFIHGIHTKLNPISAMIATPCLFIEDIWSCIRTMDATPLLRQRNPNDQWRVEIVFSIHFSIVFVILYTFFLFFFF